MKYLPTDVSSFATLINGNYLYIDKTKYIYDLFNGGSRYYFLSRPRRFGKSLLISTLKEFFSGNKDLFKGLWIYTSDYKWAKLPVINLDFSVIAHATAEELSLNLSWLIDQIAKSHGIDTTNAPSVQAKFYTLVLKLAEQNGPNSVVLLIDEYDKPIVDHIENTELAMKQREVLKAFYDTLKGLDACMRAIFVTGVSKFAKTSIFSGMNNLNDISFEKNYAQILGYTEEEIQTYFADHIKQISQDWNQEANITLNLLQNWYNGYRFSEALTKVYNPFSVLYYFKNKQLRNYWIESGSPSFLIHLLKTKFISLENLEKAQLDINSLTTFDLNNIPLIPMLFQTGYLTISGYDEETREFKLDYPNLEVSETFKKYLVVALSGSSFAEVNTTIIEMVNDLYKNDINHFCYLLQSFFAHIPYNLHIEQEKYFHSLFHFLGLLLGLEIQSEVLTNKGRIDLAITVPNHIYIFELKINLSAEKALKQILEQRYYERYLIKNRPISLVGLNFDYKQKKLSWLIEELKS